MTLALFGGTPVIQGQLPRYNSIGPDEVEAVKQAVSHSALSGFLGGNLRGGQYVQRLEELWAEKFRTRHAIACNSATSGLLAAYAVLGVGPHSTVATTCLTMSGTIAPAVLLGAIPVFCDVDRETFNFRTNTHLSSKVDVVTTTNLFGHPSDVRALRKYGRPIIEDNAQAILAMEGDKYAGTIGDIGCWSMNVHKQLNCGEGGVVTTDDDTLADKLRAFINHGEMRAENVGLNLRMTEYTAAMAISQLSRVEEIVDGRVSQAEAVIEAMDAEYLTSPVTREGCTHVYYNTAFKYDAKKLGLPREKFVAVMAAEGIPLVAGYVTPLYRLKAFEKYTRSCPVAEELHDKTMVYWSNCEWSPSKEQIAQFGAALKKIEANITKLRE